MNKKLEILNHMKNMGKITSIEAAGLFGCFDLPKKIFELKKDGYNIRTDIIMYNKSKMAEYLFEERNIYIFESIKELNLFEEKNYIKFELITCNINNFSSPYRAYKYNPRKNKVGNLISMI